MSETRTLVSFDWAIKNILRDKANYDVLEGFLSTLLKKDIKILTILESESNQEDATDKFNRVDLSVEDENGEIYIIEVQAGWERYYLQRLLYGSSKLIVDRMRLGNSFAQVKKIISVSILYFLLGEGENDYIYKGTNEFYGLNTQEKLRLEPRKRRAVVGREIDAGKNVFPEYYLIEVERFHNIIKNGIDEWVYFFKNSEVRSDFRSKNIQAAAEKLDLLKMSATERRAYEKYLSNRASEKDMIESAYDEGIEKGKADVAVNMLRMGLLTIEQIAQATGLSEETVRKLSEDE
ncbi:MAG: Rpn family recombination-promoting nuclease/putative transposase [Candidatus Electrothrix aestuarii]|uniref:Rpn family recombination-promoting nuclease/putative transposase n=1 Tax=Candidatus Electrothrix aestuarii TaxID=3062594 RepID=A0AAU8LT92_9BACT|nr:Rpn family recombination-promoting nuclease/putative transposase [Candidatus Electrothrix aestuarii]